MTDTEVVRGYPIGHVGALSPPSDPSCTPRRALESVVLQGLLLPPCGVAFSGGRDSSVVLAVATHVARREGLPDPVPVSRVFPDAPATDERKWQELVIRHLGLDNWVRLEFRDELDVVGPLATDLISRHGVIWPPTLHGTLPMAEAVAGGTLLNGEGGDEVLGVTVHRVAPLTSLVRSPRRLTWRGVRSAVGSVAPSTVRRRRLRLRRSRLAITWLRPPAMQSLIEEVTEDDVAKPLSFASSVRQVPRRRSQAYLALNNRLVALERNVASFSPFLHPDFVHALAREGGFFGVGDRTAVLRSLVPDLLPDEILARTDKTGFRDVFNAGHTVEFAKSWSGKGLDEDLVDIEELRRIWLSGRGIALTAALLQTAWLKDNRDHVAERRG